MKSILPQIEKSASKSRNSNKAKTIRSGKYNLTFAGIVVIVSPLY